MKHKLGTYKNQRGFTLIEVVAVLIIIGIVAAVAMTRATSTRDYDIISQVVKRLRLISGWRNRGRWA